MAPITILLSGAALLPDQPHPKWLSIALAGSTAAAGLEPDQEKVAALSLDKQFLRNVYSLLVPGTTLVVTDASVNKTTTGRKLQVIDADKPTGDDQ